MAGFCYCGVMLTFTAINKTFQQPDGDIQVLRHANFHLPAGQTAALLGESGCGKSTLLHLAAGLDRPNSGQITINGQFASDFNERQWNELRRRELSLVFQHYHLVPTLNVLDNLLLQARLADRCNPTLQQHLIDALGLAPLLTRLPHQLSGGQQQRVAIGRVLMHQPSLILADEPTGNLDEATSHQVMQLLISLTKETGSSLLMVTHSRLMADYLDSQWLLQDGRITPLLAKQN